MFVVQALFAILEAIFLRDLMGSEVVRSALSVIVVFLVFSGAGFLQQYVLHRFWGIQFRHWWWVTGGGFAISNLVYNLMIAKLFSQFNMYSTQTMITIIGILFLLNMVIQACITSSLQAFLLRKYFDRVWLYVISAIFSSLISAILSVIFVAIVHVNLVMYGVGTGLALLWFDHVTHEQVEDGIVKTDMQAEELA